MTTRIKFRRDTAANWTELNPTLALGEPGFEQDTNKLKIGDGETAWVDLDYSNNSSGDVLTDDHSVTITVGNTEYFAIVNRANNDNEGVEASAVAYDNDNNLITLHISEVYNGNDYNDILIISKFDDTGALLWQKQIDQDMDVSQSHDLVIDADNNIIVGVSKDPGRDSIVLIKFTGMGSVTWQKEYVGSGQYSWMELGGMVLSGTDIFVAADYEEDDDVETGIIGMLMKVSATDGTMDWATTIPDEFGTRAWGVDVTTGGDPVIVGRIGSPYADAAIVIRFDGTDGSEVWSKILFPSDANTSYAGGDIVIDSQNNIFVSVNSGEGIVHEDGNNTTVTIAHVAKLNSAGVTQWIRRIGPGPCASVATGIDCDSTGNVYLAALTAAQANPIRDISDYNMTGRNVLAIAKYSTAGAVLWQRYIETDSYEFAESRSQVTNFGNAPGNFNYHNNRGRNMSIGLNGKLAIQATVKQLDADDTWDNTRYWESITFQIDQDGREMTVGSGNEKFTVKESRIPARFITIGSILDSGNLTLSDISSNVTVSTATVTYSDGELAQQVSKSAPYAYVFGNDGTLTIPNDGDIQLTQTQVGWFSIFGPPNNFVSNDIHCNYVDPDTGDIYIGGEESDTYRGYVARYNSQGQILWSIRLIDEDENWGSRCRALKIHPTTNNLMVLAYYDGDEDNTMLIEIDPDTARIVNSTGFRDANNNSGAYGVDFDFLSDGKIAVVGRKYDEYQTYSITPVSPSGVGVLFINRSNIAGQTPVSGQWYVTGNNITGRTTINSVDRYPALTTTVRQGSGAVFTVEKSGGGYSILVTNGGTNYLAGHKIKILGTSLDGTTPENDVVITVEGLTSGAISSVSNAGTSNAAAVGPYTGLSGTNHNVASDFTITLDLNTDGTVDGYNDLPNQGNNYVVGDFITIAGTQFPGGASPANDITTTVASVSFGNVTSLGSYTGTAPTTNWRLQTDGQTPNYGGEGTWSLQKDLNGEAFVYVALEYEEGVEFGPSWTKVLSAGGIYDDEQYNSVAVDASNNIYAVGEMIARGNVAGADLDDYWCAVTSKFNSAGVHQWTRALNTTIDDHYGRSVAVRGNTIAVSHSNNGNGQTVITKLDATGAVKWQRQTTRNGSDSSVAIDTNGDIYAIVEASMESQQYNECVKVIRFNSVGEVVWRKILATAAGGVQTSEYLRSGRNLNLDETHLYISGITNAFDGNNENVFLVKIPKSGDQDGIYGAWTVMTDAYDVDKINATEATAFAPVIGTGNFETWSPNFSVNWWDPSDGESHYHTFEEIRDRDGGAIVFADGTRQTSSAQMLPQKKITNGADYRLCLDDMGKHIYVINGSTMISVPYNSDVPLPIGFTVTIVNNSGGTVSIDADGAGIIINGIVVPDNDSGQYWDLASPGQAMLLKVEEDIWFMTGGPLTLD